MDGRMVDRQQRHHPLLQRQQLQRERNTKETKDAPFSLRKVRWLFTFAWLFLVFGHTHKHYIGGVHE